MICCVLTNQLLVINYSLNTIIEVELRERLLQKSVNVNNSFWASEGAFQTNVIIEYFMSRGKV